MAQPTDIASQHKHQAEETTTRHKVIFPSTPLYPSHKTFSLLKLQVHRPQNGGASCKRTSERVNKVTSSQAGRFNCSSLSKPLPPYSNHYHHTLPEPLLLKLLYWYNSGRNKYYTLAESMKCIWPKLLNYEQHLAETICHVWAERTNSAVAKKCSLTTPWPKI